jgi:hypothetical protein
LPNWLFVRVARDPHTPGWLGVRWPVGHPETPQLVRISDDGTLEPVASLPWPGDAGFVDGGRHLVTPSGRVLSTVDGIAAWWLEAV